MDDDDVESMALAAKHAGGVMTAKMDDVRIVAAVRMENALDCISFKGTWATPCFRFSDKLLSTTFLVMYNADEASLFQFQLPLRVFGTFHNSWGTTRTVKAVVGSIINDTITRRWEANLNCFMVFLI